MIRNRHAAAAVLAITMFPLSSFAANPTNLTWTPAAESRRHSSCLLSSAGSLSGTLAFRIGAEFGCGIETVIRPGRSTSLSSAFGDGSHAFAVLQDYELGEEFRYAAGANELCQTWITYDYSTIRPWSARQYGSCWNAPYSVYEIALGSPRAVATCELQACRTADFGDPAEALDEPLAESDLGIVFIDLSVEGLPAGGAGSAEFMIALRNRVATEAVVGQAAAIWRQTDGRLFYVSAEDLAKVPTSACNDAGDIGDPRLRKPRASEVVVENSNRRSWGQVKRAWSDHP